MDLLHELRRDLRPSQNPCVGFGPGDENQAHAPERSQQDRRPRNLFRHSTRPLPGSWKNAHEVGLSLPPMRRRPTRSNRAGISARSAEKKEQGLAIPSKGSWSASGRRTRGGDRVAFGEGIPLPVEAGFFPPLPVGETPLWAPERLRKVLDAPGTLAQGRHLQPFGILQGQGKLARRRLRQESSGSARIALASTGNAASSMACVGAAAGIKVTVFLPRSAPAAKRIQVLQYGADLREIDGSYDLAFDRSLVYSRETGVLSRNTAYNPLTIEGKKTASFEIARDLARAAGESTVPNDQAAAKADQAAGWLAPDNVFVPTGDGVHHRRSHQGLRRPPQTGAESERCPVSGPPRPKVRAPSFAPSKRAGSKRGPRRRSRILFPSDVPSNGSFALAKLRKYEGRGVRRLGRGDSFRPTDAFLDVRSLRRAFERLRLRLLAQCPLLYPQERVCGGDAHRFWIEGY